MDHSSLALSPEWQALWGDPKIKAKREELIRLLRSNQARDPYVLGRLQGYLEALDWIESFPNREQVISQRRAVLRGE